MGLRLCPNRTGVNEQQVGRIRVGRQFIAMRLTQDVRHLVRVVLVHLAAHCLHKRNDDVQYVTNVKIHYQAVRQ